MSASLLALGLSTVGHAQNQAAGATEPAAADEAVTEVVVTAFKRSENLQNVPAAINVVDTAQLANAGATKLEDLQRIAPSVSFTPASGQIHSTISMRGVFSNNLAPGIPAAVGIVVDDIAQPPEAQGFNELADIERIEVLRGPQSTISGRNASAGLINIVTKAPTDHFSGKIDATATSDSEYRTQFHLSGPLSDTLSASATGYYNYFEGIIHNTVTDDDYGRVSYGARVKMRWRPTDSFEATLTGFAQNLDDEAAAPITQAFSPGANRRGLAFPGAVGGFDFDGSNRYIASPVDSYQRSDSRAVSLRMAWDIGTSQLISITGYQNEHIKQVQDVLGVIQAAINLTPGFNGTQVARLPTQTKSEELRFVSAADLPFSYVLGAYYLDTTADYDFTRLGLAPFDRVRDTGLKNKAVYARADWKLNDMWGVVGGLRWNREDIRYALTDRITPANNSSNEDSDSEVLGDLSLQYKFRPNAMLYARYARGYQGKAFDTDAPIVLANPALPYNAVSNPVRPYTALEPEKINSYELGLKSQLFDNRLTFNVAVYDAIYNGYQTQTRVGNAAGLFDFRLFSAGKVETQGLEADLSAKLTDALTVDLAAAYTKAEFDNFTSAPCYGGQTAAQGCVGAVQNLSGHTLGGTPKLRATLGAEYRMTIGTGAGLSFRGDLSWQDDVNYDLLGDPLTVQDSYAILNLSATYTSPSDRYKVTAFINNLTNEHYLQQISDNTTSFSFGAPAGGVYNVLTTRYLPRDWATYGGVRLSVNF